MSKPENLKLTIAISPKFDARLRRLAFNEKMNLGELIEIYQEVFEKQLERDKAEKVKLSCSNCKEKKYPSFMSKSGDAYLCYPCKNK